MTRIKVSSTVAAQIAGINKQRFNEAVAAGFYECAPRTAPGKTRMFDVNDVLALNVYRHLTEEGVIPAKAGPMTCELLHLLRAYPGHDRWLQVKDGFGRTTWIPADQFSANSEFISGVNIVSTRDWRIGDMLPRIIHEMEEAFYSVQHPDDRTDED
ncbi:hypothetical protein [Paracoccus chinensis]|uniref:MerR HTH family regulatory protein n=1 Tax=Paracoccus chinensis TaxID=525640 RepID=A0A1G9DF39_9RHOB|nr:hypothetical protein [Paracoccus chinensis]SDK62501.1 hypothetical protein SAMN04487971_10236 [Paracoccus chinensis]